MKSLALLFPTTNVDCTEWLKAKSRDTILDSNLRTLAAAPREVQNYDYWRPNLLALAETFHPPKPSKLYQLWYDRRDIFQWWTFWVALLLTVFFGLISSVTGIVQAWASVKGLNQGWKIRREVAWYERYRAYCFAEHRIGTGQMEKYSVSHFFFRFARFWRCPSSEYKVPFSSSPWCVPNAAIPFSSWESNNQPDA